MATSDEPLSRSDLGALAQASLDNAGCLVADAGLLAGHSRWPRAYALAILGMEEFGKYLSCVGAGTRIDEGPETDYWRRFRRNFTDHHAKYGLALATASAGLPLEVSRTFLDQFPALVADDQLLKMRALYVDHDGQGCLSPSGVQESTAAEAVRVATEVIQPFRDHWAGVDLEDAVGQGWMRLQDERISSAMAAADAPELAQLLYDVRSGP